MSFIITAYNEEHNIRDKLLNTLACRYPGELQILVASDGSTDKTNDRVREFTDQGVELVEVTERLGKENAQKAAITRATGSILVFSDVATRIDPDALEQIAQGFRNPKIGAISSEDRFIAQDGKIVGEGAYVKYEMWLRNLESRVNSLVGLSGSFFAARKSVCDNWSINVPSDFNTAINCVKSGYKAISDPKLFGYYPNIKNESNEYQRKLRTVIRGMAALGSNREVLNPFKYGLFAYQMFGHKVMRWMVPWFLLLLLLNNLILIQQHWTFLIFFIGQLIFYGLAILGFVSTRWRKNSLVKLCFFFVQVNSAILQASIQYIMGKRITKWEPSKR
jgi:glycosyltransferase involved in cell wall biosynthesis